MAEERRPERKLAAILAADVVGYSRLAGADEERTLARLRALRSDLIDPTIAVHNGRVVKRTGDGVIVEFRSVVDAVRCAIEVQRGMAERNAGVPVDRRIEFRIGIHLGDVVEETDGDLMGDGVNIAARLESVCAPGGVCLSEDAFRQVRGRVEAQFADLAEKTLKNIAQPVRTYALAPAALGAAPAPVKRARGRVRPWAAIAAALLIAALAAGVYASRSGLTATLVGAPRAEDKLATAPRLSIVVLPFANLSGDPEQEYFADGLTDDLTTDLSHLADSFVIARNTAFTYKGKPVDVKAIGRELGVRYMLEGSVRRVDETIAVNAQLISTETGAHVWADRFDGERSRLGQLQVEFVARLANSLGVELVRAESLRAMRERPNNPDADDLALQGWASYRKALTLANLNEAIAVFERALKVEPELTRAQVGLAVVLGARLNYFRDSASQDDVPRAEALLRSVFAAEPDNPFAHSAMASLLYFKRQANEAMGELRSAIEADQNYAMAHATYGMDHIFVGRAAEAFPAIETAMRLSPRDPFLNVWQFQVCHASSHLAQWEKAAEWCEKSIATNPSFWMPYVDRAAASGWLGRESEAKAAVAELLKLKPGFTVQQWANIKWSDDPTFLREYARITEGLRKAGLPEQ
jgi:adenylate cyclase